MFEDDENYFDSAAQGLRPYSDFMWFAIDSNGHIAALTSAGFAAIPILVFRSKTQYFSCFNYFLSLPKSSEITVIESNYVYLADWLEMAGRGLFTYDWDTGSSWYEAKKPYSLLASPKRPLTFSELPVEIQIYLQPICFSSVNFAEAHKLLSETDFPENNWSVFNNNF